MRHPKIHVFSFSQTELDSIIIRTIHRVKLDSDDLNPERCEATIARSIAQKKAFCGMVPSGRIDIDYHVVSVTIVWRRRNRNPIIKWNTDATYVK